MIVIVRLDLDRYDLDMIEKLIASGVITIGEATEANDVRKMSNFNKLMWIRKMQRMSPNLRREYEVYNMVQES